MKVFAGGQHLSPVHFPSLVVWMSFGNIAGARCVQSREIRVQPHFLVLLQWDASFPGCDSIH